MTSENRKGRWPRGAAVAKYSDGSVGEIVEVYPAECIHDCPRVTWWDGFQCWSSWPSSMRPLTPLARGLLAAAMERR